MLFNFFGFGTPISLRNLRSCDRDLVKPTKTVISAYKYLTQRGFFMEGVAPNDIYNLINPCFGRTPNLNKEKLAKVFGEKILSVYYDYLKSVFQLDFSFYSTVDIAIIWLKILEENGVYIPLHTKSFVAKAIVCEFCYIYPSFQIEQCVADRSKDWLEKRYRQLKHTHSTSNVRKTVLTDDWKEMIARLSYLFGVTNASPLVSYYFAEFDTDSDEFVTILEKKLVDLLLHFGVK